METELTKQEHIEALWSAIRTAEKEIHTIKDSFLKLHKEELDKVLFDRKLDAMFSNYIPQYTAVSEDHELESDECVKCNVHYNSITHTCDIELLEVAQGIEDSGLKDVLEEYIFQTVNTNTAKNDEDSILTLKLRQRGESELEEQWDVEAQENEIPESEVVEVIEQPLESDESNDVVVEDASESLAVKRVKPYIQGNGKYVYREIECTNYALIKQGVILTEQPIKPSDGLKITRLAQWRSDLKPKQWTLNVNIFNNQTLAEAFIDWVEKVTVAQRIDIADINHIYLDENSSYAMDNFKEHFKTLVEKSLPENKVKESLTPSAKGPAKKSVSKQMQDIVNNIDQLMGKPTKR